MPGRIYLLNDQADLVAMEEASYDSEKLLQQMLAQYPDLLAGEQINEVLGIFRTVELLNLTEGFGPRRRWG